MEGIRSDIVPETDDNFRFERALRARGFACVAGSDEAGRGPLAGPVVAASVFLPPDCDHSLFLDSKKISKTNSVTSQLLYGLDPHDIHVGPSDYVPWLDNRKFAYIKMEGKYFGDTPVNIELKLEVWDSPNSAGVVIDAVRCVKLGMDNGLKGALEGPSSYFMKSPPQQFSDSEARDKVEEFIASYGNKAGAPAKKPETKKPEKKND